MADERLTVEALEIVIERKTSEAASKTDVLIQSLERLKKALKNTSVFDKYTASLDSFNASIDRIDTEKLNALATVLEKLKAIKSIPKKALAGVSTAASVATDTPAPATGGGDDATLTGKVPLLKWTKGIKSFGELTKKSYEALGTFGKKALMPFEKLAKSVLRVAMYRIIRRALSTVVKLMKEGVQNLYEYDKFFGGTFSKSLDQATTSINYFKNALAVGIAPVLERLIPIFSNLIDTLAEFGNGLAVLDAKNKGLSTVTIASKSMKEFSDNAKKAKQALMGFDELNTLGQNGIAGMFEEISITNETVNAYKQRVAEIKAIFYASLIFLGAAVALLGHPVIGIGMMVAGGAGSMYNAAENESFMSEKMKRIIGLVLGIGGTLLFAVGCVLAFTGAATAIGIGMMVAGAAGIGAAVTLNWDIIPDMLRKVGAGALSILSLYSAVIGALFLLVPGGFTIGLGMLFAAYKGSEKAVEIDDNAVTRWIANLGKTAKDANVKAWNAIKNWFVTDVKVGFFNLQLQKGIFDKLKDIISNDIPDWFKKSWNKVSTWFNTTVSPFFNGVKEFFTDTIPTGLENAWKEIKSFFLTDIPKFFTETLPEKIKGFGIAFANIIIDGLNKISTIGDNDFTRMLGINGARVFPEIKRIEGYATGGFPEDGLFFANSQELVGQFANGRNAVVNNDQIIAGVSEGVYNAVVAALGSGNENRDINLNVYLDGKQIKASYDAQTYRSGAKIATGGVIY